MGGTNKLNQSVPKSRHSPLKGKKEIILCCKKTIIRESLGCRHLCNKQQTLCAADKENKEYIVGDGAESDGKEGRNKIKTSIRY